MWSWELNMLALFHVLLLGGTARASSILFTGGTIISFDVESSRTNVLRNSSLLVEDDTISQIFHDSTPTAYPNGTEIIDTTGKIITPGFIDTHHHLWGGLYKTLASNTTLAEYFARFGEASQQIQYMTPQDKYLSQLTGSLELLNAGTTTVVDHAHGVSSEEIADALFNATLESGIRIYYSPTVHQLPNNFTIQAQLDKISSIARDPRLQDSTVSLGLSFDGFDGGSPESIQQLWDLVNTLNLSLVTTHHAGGPWILDNNSPTLLNTLGWLNTSLPIIFSHAAFITAADMNVLRQTNQYISTTPESDAHYGLGRPHAHLIQDQASLGVDTHFTYSTDMVGQARMWLQALRQQGYERTLVEDGEIPFNNPMSVEQAFYLIGRAGALALRRPDLGILIPGAKADILVFDGESPNMLGWSDPVAAVVLHSNVGDIKDVMVNGKFMKRDGKLTYAKYVEVKKGFLESVRKIQGIWARTEWAPLTGKFANVTGYGVVTQIDTLRGEGTGY